ncbi:threonine aldolase family protein [Spirochaeta africana]|uniref:Threonine aldolase n=1 Tax=Spirochaeta africana (strain ATCC 700263 / DSM 8902 / Z-7692) TaxID=889378 RepID=H9UG22_SPIAZ|nr:beta-eliminating lyase-related protein [Spirochaeta africana]AFG36465.1 threonine aldolase [Spirochaeta africana DSM 8902]
MEQRFFASDNSSPAHPAVLEAVARANNGHAGSYGADPWTAEAIQQLQQLFGTGTTVPEVLLAYNGTGANTMALRALVPRYGSVLCTGIAHINRDEAGAVQAAGAGRLCAVPGENGKLGPDDIRRWADDQGVEHHSQPAAVSITQPTEIGTLYSLTELQEIAACCREHRVKLHMDGARFANACVALGCSPAEAAAGVDMLAFGGTKNGMLFGEAVVVFDAETAGQLRYHRKQLAQLHSKMRYIGAQFTALLQDGLYLENAAAANAAAAQLAAGVAALQAPDVAVVYPVEANGVFLRMPAPAAQTLQQHWPFYCWEPGVYRIMCSWDTREEDIASFLRELKKECG